MRYSYAITPLDDKLLDAITTLDKNQIGGTNHAVLSYLQSKWEDSAGMTLIPLRFPTSMAEGVIEFYELSLERLRVIPKNKYATEDYYELEAPEKFTEVTKIINALDKLDESLKKEL